MQAQYIMRKVLRIKSIRAYELNELSRESLV